MSGAELEAETGGGTGADLGPALVREGVWVLAQPTGAAHPPRFTLSYLIEDDQHGLHLVDPGIDDAEGANRARLSAVLQSLGRSEDDLASTIVTHLHHDHLALAEHLQREHSVPLALHRADQEAALRLAEAGPSRAETTRAKLVEWGVPERERGALEVAAGATATASASATTTPTSPAPAPLRPVLADVLLDDDEHLAIPGRTVRVLPTPGHTPGHIALVDERERLLFTGDHLLPTLFPGIGLGGPTPDAIGDYLRSLDALEPFARVETPDDPGYEVLPGHGHRFTGLADRIDTTRRHHVRRSHEVAAVLAESPGATTWQIAERIHWTAGFAGLEGFFLLSALRQTAMHVAHLSMEAR
ncbi:MBL fold metallo-hydrolase [Herbiconiux sp. P15]|uniref:MBL fold metallo-hydrolase n=1 Tax=Herbiconiux liukaitaii TaxID=3342799 RepID=UPI0035BB5042